MACSAIVHGIEPKEEKLLRYLESDKYSQKSLPKVETYDFDQSKTKLGWRIKGSVFEDGSSLKDWKKIEGSPWNWQYDDHELTFEIYESRGRYWKLYRARRVPIGAKEYDYHYGGQACRVVKVSYKTRTRSPHSGTLKDQGDIEWVRVEEVDEDIHDILLM